MICQNEKNMYEYRVYTDMVADLYHVGHIRFLDKVCKQSRERAKKNSKIKNSDYSLWLGSIVMKQFRAIRGNQLITWKSV